MKSKWTAALAALGMAVLILDAKTALIGANAGIQVCLQTVIPSLFPFFVLSILLNSALMERKMDILSPVASLLRVPKESIALIMVGLLGGYPVGAQAVAQAQRQGRLDKADGQRMLAFCSNAGPAFIFGIGTRLFDALWVCFVVWGIHIVSAWLVALLTPGKPARSVELHTQCAITLPKALRKALEILATVCGWVVLFRILIAFADQWVLWAVSKEVRVAIIGTLELANGCCGLLEAESTGLRVSLFAALLSFGGLCVAMQTASVCTGVSTRFYMPGKLTQGAISLLLCCPAQLLLPAQHRWLPGIPQIVVCCTVCVIYRFFAVKTQKSSSIPAAAVV